MKVKEERIELYKLDWDSNYFGVHCVKVILHKELTIDDWENLIVNLSSFQFVSIENRNSNPINAQLIGKYTNAFLADVNIQFKKSVEDNLNSIKSVSIHQGLEMNHEVLEIADFKYSKFVDDTELLKRGGDKVYDQWLKNSFGNKEKFFAISKDCNNKINGFVLYSYPSKNVCLIELIAVLKNTVKSGIGTKLFKIVEKQAYEQGCNELKVGTQARNIEAINFYHKLGCKQVQCHQIFHLWNL